MLDNNDDLETKTIENDQKDVTPEDNKNNISDIEERLNEFQKTVEKKDKEIIDCVDLLKRSRAEFDNYRKRTNKEKETKYDEGFGDAVNEILPIVDNLERAVDCGASNEVDDSFYEGVKMVLKQIYDCFTKCGIEEIAAQNKKFDPNFHNAVMHVEDDNYSENEVIEVLQKGYKYKERILRYSMVKVAN